MATENQSNTSADDFVTAGDELGLLRRALGCYPTGVAAVCANIDGQLTGLTISSFAAVSFEPPLVSICAMRTSRRWTALRTAPRLGLSFLTPRQADLCRSLSSCEADALRDTHVTVTAEGSVFLPDATAWLDCSLHSEIDAGDHTIALLSVHRVQSWSTQVPLVYHAARFRRLEAI